MHRTSETYLLPVPPSQRNFLYKARTTVSQSKFSLLQTKELPMAEETLTNGNFVTHIPTDGIRYIYDRENHEAKGN